jgi:putative mycofactocin binding protein MftB
VSIAPSGQRFDLDGAWQLHPQVSVRPERFGALLYHFGTRRLSFIKNTALRDVVVALGDAPSARSAMSDCGIAGVDIPRITNALAGLAESSMICERVPA